MHVVIDTAESNHLASATQDDLTSWLIAILLSIADSHIQAAYLASDDWARSATSDCKGFLLEIHRLTTATNATDQWVASFMRDEQTLRIHCHIEGGAIPAFCRSRAIH